MANGLAGAMVIVATGCAYERPMLETRGDAAPADAGGEVDAAADAADAACALDEHCPSRVCLAATCVAPAAVRYVAVDGDDQGPCTMAAPCGTIPAAIAQRPLGADAIVSIDEGDHPGTVTIDVGDGPAPFDVYLIGWGDGRPAILATDDGTNVDGIELVRGRALVRNLAVRGSPSNPSSDAIWCASGTTLTVERVVAGPSRNDGIECVDCTLAVIFSEARDNAGFGVRLSGSDAGQLVVAASIIEQNALGGLDVGAVSCAILSSVIRRNGSADALVGGASLRCQGALLEHNTFVDNLARAGRPTELSCLQPTAGRNNLFAGGGSALTSGCTHTYSLFSPPPALPGVGNRSANDPGFVSSTDWHLAATSLAIDAGDPATEPVYGLDIDGEPRFVGVPDIGADERP